jgi:hypothetical protein
MTEIPHDAGASAAKLNELDKDEFRDTTRRLWPVGYTAEDFDRAWAEFQEMKRKRAMQ